jgi:nucleoid-associated protein YgaU
MRGKSRNTSKPTVDSEKNLELDELETPEVEEIEEVTEIPEAEVAAVVEEQPKPQPKAAEKVSAGVPTAEVVTKESGAKNVKVQFIVSHSFNIGVVRYDMKKGDRMMVELHLANLFASRNIAYIVG